MNERVAVSGVSHVGLRVLDAARAEAFYEKLGFQTVSRHEGAKVVILRNAAGVELNLIVNANVLFDGTNVLMDVPEKRAGITHVALTVRSMSETVAALAALHIAITEGPVSLGGGLSLFVRDPDRNVIELREER